MNKKRTATVYLLFVSAVFCTSVFAEDELTDYQFKHRIIIIDMASGSNEQIIQSQLDNSARALDDRRLLVWGINNSSVQALHGSGPFLTQRTVKTLNNSLAGKAVYLIGLDGGIKADYDEFNLAKIFADIDRMPMRKAELRAIQGFN